MGISTWMDMRKRLRWCGGGHGLRLGAQGWQRWSLCRHWGCIALKELESSNFYLPQKLTQEKCEGVGLFENYPGDSMEDSCQTHRYSQVEVPGESAETGKEASKTEFSLQYVGCCQVHFTFPNNCTPAPNPSSVKALTRLCMGNLLFKVSSCLTLSEADPYVFKVLFS